MTFPQDMWKAPRLSWGRFLGRPSEMHVTVHGHQGAISPRHPHRRRKPSRDD
jgi:hypothetical protein